MQNKGFVKTFAIALALICLFYLSFTFVTSHYDTKAKEMATVYAQKNAGGNTELYDKLYQAEHDRYLDSMSTEKVWMTFDWTGIEKMKGIGYSLKECREKEIGLGLDLKGGMSVIVEVDVASVLRSLGDVENEAFNTALSQAIAEEKKGSNKDILTLFVEKFQANKGKDQLAGIFSTKLRDQIKPQDKDESVIAVLNTEVNSAADNSFNILRTRIDRFGVVAPNIQKLNDRSDRILIELPGVKEPERVRKLLQGNANLEFWKTYNLSEIQNRLSSISGLSEAVIRSLGDSVSADSIQIQLGFSKPLNAYIQPIGYDGAVVGLVHKNDTTSVGKILRRFASDVKASGERDINFAWGFKPEENTKESFFALYALSPSGMGRNKGPVLDGDVVINAKADQAQHGSAWEVSMQMDSRGTQSWANITGAEKGKSIAIVVDGHVYSAPRVNDKIEGGRSSITGNFTYEDASDLENVLKSGRMKAGVRIIQEDVVGPSLGQEAIDAGIISFLLAIALLMIYMCCAYGVIPGLVANGALLLNLFFTMGTLAAFQAVLTLPGITGLVLTLAMAVDANVLIYERTKEELRAGKNVKTALTDGYKHAFSAIFDANVTSIITGVILIIFGTGAIQGFATTLIIGIAASFLTAVFLTRIFYEFMLEKGKFRNLTFTTPISKNLFVDTKINFLGMTKTITIGIAIFIVVGFASLFFNGLNTGIDFTGGRNYLVRFDKPVNAHDVEEALIPMFYGANVRVITTGAGSQTQVASQLRITTNYQIESATDSAETNVRTILLDGFKKMNMVDQSTTLKDMDDKYIVNSQRVGPSIADDLKASATIAVLIAIICMALYILARFHDKAFSIGTFVAVAHDALFVILAYSLLYKLLPFSMEVDQAFIAAVLTVVGYSINDKVVIFDRIREIRKNYPKRDITTTINEALNSTLGRTVNTGLSSVLVVLCIFLLGGDTIKSFTFAILIGIIIGTFSSLFVATPIAWKMLLKKQLEKTEGEK